MTDITTPQAPAAGSASAQADGPDANAADAGDAGRTRDLVTTAAEQAQGISSRLDDGGFDRTLEDARRLARNRPGLLLAGDALVGFVAAARVARNVDTGALKEAASPQLPRHDQRARAVGSRSGWFGHMVMCAAHG